MTREEFLQQLPALVKNYQPADQVLTKISNLNLLMIIGPSGVGKTSIIERLGLQYVISDTTRRPRSGEQEGIDFYFREDYDQIIQEFTKGQFLQAAVDPSGDLKASKADYYPDSGDIVMAIVTDAVPTVRELGFKSTISAFITPPSYEEWMRRMGKRQMSDEQLAKRLSEAKRSLEFALKDDQMHFILNDDLTDATNQVKDLLSSKTDKNREAEAHQAAKTIFHRLSNPLNKDASKKHIITIAGRPGSGKSTTAKTVASRLGYKHFSSGDLFRALGKERGVDVLKANMPGVTEELDRLVDGKLRAIGHKDDKLVIDSRTAWHWIPQSFKVFLNLDMELAAQRILNESNQARIHTENISEDVSEYAELLKHRLDVETKRYKAIYNIDPYDMDNYNLIIDTSVNDIESTVKQVLQGYEEWLERWHS